MMSSAMEVISSVRTPLSVPREYFDQFPVHQVRLPPVLANDLADIPPAGVRIAKPQGDHARVIRHQQWQQAVQGYLASIRFADHQVGRLIDALDASSFAANTIIVLWTDHGWHLGEKRHWRKFTLWERATKTPLAFVVPGVTSRGGRCDRPVNLLDIYPTLIDICGLPANQSLEGVSLAPLLSNPNAVWDRPSLTTHGRNNHALRSDRYRYIRYADGTEELYDHKTDPREWNNIADNPEYAAIKQQLAMWFPRKNVPESPRD